MNSSFFSGDNNGVTDYLGLSYNNEQLIIFGSILKAMHDHHNGVYSCDLISKKPTAGYHINIGKFGLKNLYLFLPGILKGLPPNY